MNYLQALHEKGLKLEEYSPAIQKKFELIEAFKVLEQDLIKSINKFNPEVYKARKERISKVPKKSAKKPEIVQEVKEEKEIAQKLDELKKKVEIKKELFVGKEVKEEPNPQPEEVEAEEIDDYKKTETVKPKKMSTSFMLMGIGVFFLTWGGINLWRERR